MTGTSIDALDVALVRLCGRGLDLTPRFVRGVSRALGRLADDLRAIAEQRPMTSGEIARITRDFALLHAEAVRSLVQDERIDFVCVHGQTVFHQPPLTWQLFSAPTLAMELGTPVVTDLRSADVARGGQGAPITPLADWLFFRSSGSAAVVNLGGFCNITLLPAVGSPITDIDGFDVCACNHVLDELARVVLRAPFDDGGRAALGGRVHPAALDDLVRALRGQSSSRRSLGTGDETADWIRRWQTAVSAPDLCATACQGLGATIARRVDGVQRVLLAGGGVNNAALVRAIRLSSSAPVAATDDAGLPGSFREAAEMAVLGALCADRVPITLPRVTHVPDFAPIAGVWCTP